MDLSENKNEDNMDMDINPEDNMETNVNSTKEEKILIPINSNNNSNLISSDFLKNIMEQQKLNINPISNVELTPFKLEDLSTSTIQAEIDRWKSDNSYVKLNVISLKGTPDFHLSLSIGPDSIPFEMYTNDKWQPMVNKKIKK